MGREYDADLAIGYVIDLDSLPKKFKKARSEISHMEDRFDPKTGKKLPEQVKVVDQEANEVWVLDGKEFEDKQEFFDALAERIGGSYGSGGDFVSGEGIVHFIGPKIPKSESESEEAGVSLAWLFKEHSRIIAIGERLRQLGFEVGAPRVYPILNVS